MRVKKFSVVIIFFSLIILILWGCGRGIASTTQPVIPSVPPSKASKPDIIPGTKPSLKEQIEILKSIKNLGCVIGIQKSFEAFGERYPEKAVCLYNRSRIPCKHRGHEMGNKCYDCAKSIEWIIKGDFTGSGMEEVLIVWEDDCISHAEGYTPISLVRQNKIIKNFRLNDTWIGTSFIAAVKPKTGKTKFLYVAGNAWQGEEGWEDLDLCELGKNKIECKKLLRFDIKGCTNPKTDAHYQIQHGIERINVTDVNNDGIKDLVVQVKSGFLIDREEGQLLVKRGFSFKEDEDFLGFEKMYIFEFIFDGQDLKLSEKSRRVYREFEEDEKIINDIMEACDENS